MSSGSKTYGIERARAHPAGHRRDEIAVAEDVDDVRPRERAEHERQARRDPHPAIAERRRELVHPNAGCLDTLTRPSRAAGGAPTERSDVVTTSTSWPRAASPSVSSRATQIGPPNATAGQ